MIEVVGQIRLRYHRPSTSAWLPSQLFEQRGRRRYLGVVCASLLMPGPVLAQQTGSVPNADSVSVVVHESLLGPRRNPGQSVVTAASILTRDGKAWINQSSGSRSFRHPRQEGQHPDPSFGWVAAAAALGATSGGLLGWATATGDDPLEGAVPAVVGAWFGGAVGGTAVSRRAGPSLLGSGLGVAVGALAIFLAPDNGGWILYPLVHGLVVAGVTELGS